MKAQLLTVALIYDTYNFEQLYMKNISFIKYRGRGSSVGRAQDCWWGGPGFHSHFLVVGSVSV